MLTLLRALFVAIIATMLWATGRAGMEQSMFAIPGSITGNLWFKATLLDAYFAFLTFYIWVAWKENSSAGRALWFFAIMLWGNIAMSCYMLRELFAIKSADSLSTIWSTQRKGRLTLPIWLNITAVIAYGLAAKALF